MERYRKDLPEAIREECEEEWISEEDRALLQEININPSERLLKQAGGHRMPSHGDLSHWNCFMDRSKRLCLIDYEEMGEYLPLYDWFHLLLKPSLLKPGCLFPEKELVCISELLMLKKERVLSWMWLYLLLEIRKDMYRNQDLQSAKIEREIFFKRALWLESEKRLLEI